MESGFVVVIIIDGCTLALCVLFVYCCTIKSPFWSRIGNYICWVVQQGRGWRLCCCWWGRIFCTWHYYCFVADHVTIIMIFMMFMFMFTFTFMFMFMLMLFIPHVSFMRWNMWDFVSTDFVRDKYAHGSLGIDRTFIRKLCYGSDN